MPGKECSAVVETGWYRGSALLRDESTKQEEVESVASVVHQVPPELLCQIKTRDERTCDRTKSDNLLLEPTIMLRRCIGGMMATSLELMTGWY